MVAPVPVDRVVAVVAHLPDGRRRWGTGFLITAGLVMTAWHCTVADVDTGERVPLVVRRWADDAWQSATVVQTVASRTSTPVNGSWGLDVALLVLQDPPWADQPWSRPRFARVDADVAGELVDCVALGYPTWELKPDEELTTAEVRGFIRQGEGRGGQARQLVLRDDKLGEVRSPTHLDAGPSAPSSPWGGLSGALVFYRGQVLGHVVQHRSLLGNNPLSVVPIDRIARSTAPKARRIAELLGLPAEDALPWAGGAVVELAGLVDLLGPDEDLPIVAGLTPYQLGADPTRYGNSGSHGEHDPYLRRTANEVDDRLRDALGSPRRLVLLVGPSKAGKTRSAFEAIRARWPEARLAKPAPGNLADLIDHPRIAATDWPLVLWLDDLQRYLIGDRALTPARLEKLFTRPGPTIVMATLRQEERARLADHPDLTPGARQLLDDASGTTVDLAPTSADATEQAAAQAAYPGLDLDTFGLAEQLAGAPALLRTYGDADPLLRAVLQAAIDWERVGMDRPVPAADLLELARSELDGIAGYLDPSAAELEASVRAARTPPKDGDGRTTGQLAALQVHRTDDTWSYSPYPYLVAHDNGQDSSARPVPGPFWPLVLDRASPEESNAIGSAAYYRDNLEIAVRGLAVAAGAGNDQAMRNLGWLYANETSPLDLPLAQEWYRRAADLGNASAMRSIGLLLSTKQVPPDLDAARVWLVRAAESGRVDAMSDLGLLHSTLVSPPDLDAARGWYRRAADLGDLDAMRGLAIVLSDLVVPPELDEARAWYVRAADRGQVDAMRDLGVLLSTQISPPDLDGARAWYEKAATSGSTEAMHGLALLLSDQLDPPDLDGARTWYQKAANLGNTDAMHGLGVLLSHQLDPPDLDSARTWYQKAADLGNTSAMNNLAILLSDRLDPPDLDSARTWYQTAADLGNANAMYGLALLLSDRLDPPELDGARTWYEKAADLGNADAMHGLAVLLSDMLDPPDLDGSRPWYQKAADLGNIEAMRSLAILLSTQLSPPDLDGARTWYEKAANLGNTEAMRSLAILLSTQLSPPDLDGARTWYEKAANLGNTEAMRSLAILLSTRISPPDLEGAQTSYRKAADLGNTEAMRGLAILLSTRISPPDLEGAQTSYRKAADLGNTDAMHGLAVLLSDMLDPPDLDGSRPWYQTAADLGNANAMYGLALLLSDRLDPPELDGARTWYEKAADLGNTEAMHGLAILLATKLDPPDLAGAQTWYRKAADLGNTNAMYGLAILLSDKLDPPDLDGAIAWYQKAADLGSADAMYGLAILLSDKLDPPDLDGAIAWYQKAADLGSADAMTGLAFLLSTQVDPPDLDGAQTWYRRAADLGQVLAAVHLGNICATRGDRHGAVTAWQQALATADEPDISAYAALSLAAVAAFEERVEDAVENLTSAEAHGASVAAVCAASLSADPAVQQHSCDTLTSIDDDGDALNFLGLAAYRAGDVDGARRFWTTSAAANDGVAPLLLSLTTG